MIAWTDNENWGVSLLDEYCGYVSERLTPCQHRRPCPLHDSSLALARSDEVEAGGGSPFTPPAPSLFDSWESA